MDAFILFPIIALLLSAWAATAISRAVHKSLVRNGNSNAKLFQVLTWFGCFILITGVAFVIILSNLRLER